MGVKTFKILAIDGGGIRGIFPAYILNKIRNGLNIDFVKEFDLIVGTSTGSIIAAGLAIDYPIEDILLMYREKGKEMFSKNFFGTRGFFRSKYEKDYLEETLNQVFGDLTLSATRTRLMIPSTDIGNATVHVFKSPYLKEFVRDKDVKISDAVNASCSAPLFFNPHKISRYLLADGGLWANNPSLVGLVEAMGKLKVNLFEIKILSIGTGIGKKYYEINGYKKREWGFLTGWENQKLIDMILNLQSQSSHNMVKLILPEQNYLQINFETDNNLPLDDIKIIESLESKADKEYTYNIKAIKAFFNL